MTPLPHFKKRKIWARVWIFVIFLLLMGANYFFYRFSIDSLNTYPVSRGMTFGCALWSIVLLVAMWMRYGWARYILISLLCLATLGFTAIILMLRSDSVVPMPAATHAVIAGLGLYILALIPLGASSALRHFLGPRTAGGH